MGGVQTKIMVDTNILYDLYCKTDRLEIATGVVLDKELYLSQCVFYELGSLLKRSLGSRITGFILENIKNSCSILSITSEQEREAIEVMKKYQFRNPKKEYTLTDAIQLVQAGEYNLELFTSDEAMGFYNGASVRWV